MSKKIVRKKRWKDVKKRLIDDVFIIAVKFRIRNFEVLAQSQLLHLSVCRSITIIRYLVLNALTDIRTPVKFYLLKNSDLINPVFDILILQPKNSAIVCLGNVNNRDVTNLLVTMRDRFCKLVILQSIKART